MPEKESFEETLHRLPDAVRTVYGKDLVTDARLLHDENRFFELYLEKLRNRLKELGARKVKRGS